MPEAGSKVAAPPSRREKAMMKGRPEEREHSDDDLDVPKERDWTVRPVKMTPEGREGKKRREARRKVRRNKEMREERQSGVSASATSGSAASASAKRRTAPGAARPSEPKAPPPIAEGEAGAGAQDTASGRGRVGCSPLRTAQGQQCARGSVS